MYNTVVLRGGQELHPSDMELTVGEAGVTIIRWEENYTVRDTWLIPWHRIEEIRMENEEFL